MVHQGTSVRSPGGRECHRSRGRAHAATRQRYHGIDRPIDLPYLIDRGNVISPDPILCTICRVVSNARMNLCPEEPVEAHRYPTSEDLGYREMGT
jgi:hypothetical protein